LPDLHNEWLPAGMRLQMSQNPPASHMTSEVLSCPQCGTELDDEQWCGHCDRHISDQEIAQHDREWGDLWYEPR